MSESINKIQIINELKLKNLFINNNEECSICYEKFISPKYLYILNKCNHIFCKKCIYHQMNIYKYNKEIFCPLCRTKNINIKYHNELHNQNNEKIFMRYNEFGEILSWTNIPLELLSHAMPF